MPSINDFLRYLEQCARSPYTVRAYARGLAHFAGWLHEAGVDLDAVTRPVVGQYIGAFGRGSRRHASLIDRPPPNEGRQARTVNHRLSVLASYFAFRIRQDDDRGDGASHPSAEAGREQYAFAYDAVTIEELERAVTAMRSPTGARP